MCLQYKVFREEHIKAMFRATDEVSPERVSEMYSHMRKTLLEAMNDLPWDIIGDIRRENQPLEDVPTELVKKIFLRM